MASVWKNAPYDVFVDWDARLAREMPFFRDLFEQVGVERLLDAGCGSARHAIEFAKMGIEVVAFDPSEDMLASARENARAAGVPIRLEQAVFEDAGGLVDAPVDAVLSLGNGLPHVEGLEGLRRAFAAFESVLAPDGVLVLHLVNHERLSRGNVRAFPPKFRSTPEGDFVFLRIIDRVDGAFVFNFITLSRPLVGEDTGLPDPADIDGAPWALEDRRSRHTAMPPSLLAEELARAGFARVEFFGDHERTPLDEGADESVIVVARR